MIAHCERCNLEFEFDYGNVNLGCQQCGSTDVRFDSNFLLIPVALSGEKNDRGQLIYSAGDKFNCTHQFGTIWEVKPIPRDKDSEIEDEVGEKEPQGTEEAVNEEGPKEVAEKPPLIKPKRGMRAKIGI